MILNRARERTGALRALRASILVIGAGLAVALAGCSAHQYVSNGTPVMTVTADAAGNFTGYVVGIDGLSLVRSDGYVDNLVPYLTGGELWANLARRVDLTELLAAPGVPTGTYTSMTITLDYTPESLPAVPASALFLQGQSTPATVSVASNLVTVTINFAQSNPLVISLNHSSRLDIQFDLAASSSISGNTVTVTPFVTASPTPVETQPVRARGQLVLANPSAGTFVENIQPFEEPFSAVGALTVNTSASTYFDVDGNVYQGAAGLAAVNALPTFTPMTAYGAIGDLSTITPGFTATAVYAGTAVSSPAYRQIKGTVTARSGGTLTVSGAELIYQEGVSAVPFAYYPTATVDVAPATIVTEDGEIGKALSQQSISVGQQIDAVGVQSSVGTSTSVSLDATSGNVRMQSTAAWGTLSSGADGSATLDLLELGPYDASAFNFAGTGTSSADDANPASYLLDTGTVDESATSAGTLINAYGFVTPFGSAPPDFDATSVTQSSSQETDLIVQWTGGTTAPFTSYNGTSLVVNLSGANVAAVVTGPQSTPLTGTPSVTISGASQLALGSYAFTATNGLKSGITMFNAPSAFASDLTGALDGSTAVFKLVAIGSFDSATNTFTANRVDLEFK